MIAANALELPLRDNSVRTVVTSPPYLEQRTYGASELELGHEGALEPYVAQIADVFDELRRVLVDDGSAWLNIGDKSNGSGGAGGDWTRAERAAARAGNRRRGARRSPMQGARRFYDQDYADRSFLDVPGAVLRELLRRGWRLRLPIVWNKIREAPESLRHAGRPRWSHEMIYLLAPTAARPKFYPSLLVETGSVWTFPPGGSGPAHLAPFPDELARRCILASSLPGETVFDPFGGSGTTERVAGELGRYGVSTDLYVPGLELEHQAEPKRSSVDLKDLAALELGTGRYYFAARRIAAGEAPELVARDLKLTDDQVAYVVETTGRSSADAAEA